MSSTRRDTSGVAVTSDRAFYNMWGTRRMNGIHVLWIVIGLIFVTSISSSWLSLFSYLTGENRGRTLNMRVNVMPPPSSTPEHLRRISYPELREELTGQEIMALRVEIPETENTGDEVVGIKQIGHGDFPRSCSEIDMEILAEGMACGTPLGSPCFDRTRCRWPPHGPGPSIYVYDGVCSLHNSSNLPPSNESLQLSHTWREAAREAGVLSEDYHSACMFVHVNKLVDKDPCPVATPLWNSGANHLMVDLTDLTRDRRPAVARSYAIDVASNVRTCYYRSGYDFAMPLRHKWDLMEVYGGVPPWERDFFLTVKGNLYLSGSGSEERLSLVPLHNEEEGTVIALTCFDLHGEHLLPENTAFCDALNSTASRYEYSHLMSTTFGLVPGGRSPATYRLAEVMGAGAIPVIVARDYVRPFPERIDWPSMSFMFTPDEVGEYMMDVLRAVEPKKLWEMQQKSMDAFLEVFGNTPGYSKIARGVIDEMIERVEFHR